MPNRSCAIQGWARTLGSRTPTEDSWKGSALLSLKIFSPPRQRRGLPGELHVSEDGFLGSCLLAPAATPAVPLSSPEATTAAAIVPATVAHRVHTIADLAIPLSAAQLIIARGS